MNKKAGIRGGVMAPILPDELIVREDALQWLLTCAGQEQQAEECLLKGITAGGENFYKCSMKSVEISGCSFHNCDF